MIENPAMIVPLEALLLGNSSVRPLGTKDFRVSGERRLPLARMREWNVILKSAKLMSDCSIAEFQREIDNLTDTTSEYFPKIILEFGVSHKTGHLNSGILCRDFGDEVALITGASGSDPALPSAAVAMSKSFPPVAVAGSNGMTSSSSESVAAAPGSAISESDVVQ